MVAKIPHCERVVHFYAQNCVKVFSVNAAKICMHSYDGILVIELWVNGNKIQYCFIHHCLYMLPSSQVVGMSSERTCT
jgi:hypothetical protein